MDPRAHPAVQAPLEAGQDAELHRQHHQRRQREGGVLEEQEGDAGHQRAALHERHGHEAGPEVADGLDLLDGDGRERGPALGRAFPARPPDDGEA